MSDYDDDETPDRHDTLASERRARREAADDARDRRASLAATKAQIKAARGHDGTPAEPDYKPEAEWTTTERQAFAARGVKPLNGADDGWGDDD